MVEPRAFIAIEQTMAAAMRAQWDKRATALAATLQPLVDAGKWGDAQSAINDFSLLGVVGDVRPRLEELAVTAVLFGAHHAAGSVKATTFMNGSPMPKEVAGAIDQLVDMVEQNGRDYVCGKLHLAVEALKQADPRAHMQKDSIYDEASKRPDAQLAEEYPPDDDETGAQAKAREKLYGLGHDIPGLQKDDITEAQLEETGGLLEPEQAQVPTKKRKVQKADRTLYVHRDLINAADFLGWAKSQGFSSTMPVADLHVTLCYSKTPVDWEAMGEAPPEVTVMEGARALEQFGKASVLTFDSSALNARNAKLMSEGCTSDFPEYHSHMTITYDLPDRPLDAMEPYAGPLIFGPEIFEEIKKGGFDPDALVEEVLKWERFFKDADMSLADKLNEAVRNGGTVAIDTGASLTTSRLVSLGFLAEAKERGTQKYVVNEVLDGRTCPVCLYMNGKTFDVESQFDRLVQQLSNADPDSGKSLAPWPDQSAAGMQSLYGQSLNELQSNGLGGPPYHPGCRGMLTLVGSVEEDVPLGGPVEAAVLTDPGILDALREAIDGMSDQEAKDAAEHALDIRDYDAALAAATGADPDMIEQALPEREERDPNWTPDAIDALKWARFDVTDPDAFEAVDAAYEAKHYAEAQKLIDDWTASHFSKSDQPSALEPEPVPTDEVDSSPNAAKKKRKLQGAAGREQEYGDIQPDSSSIAFDNSGVGDTGAPIDRE